MNERKENATFHYDQRGAHVSNLEGVPTLRAADKAPEEETRNGN